MGDWATITAEVSPVAAVQPPLERRSQPPADSYENTTERKDKAEISAAGAERFSRSQTEHSGFVRETPKDEKPGQESREQKSETGGNKNGELTDEERREIIKLQARDREVRAHEQAHMAAAGSQAAGGPHYEYEKGPDGKMYAVGGEVQIVIRGGGTPEERLRNAEQAARAALAPASPSAQDRAVAAEARAMVSEARAEIANEAAAKKNDANAVPPVLKAITAYTSQDTEGEVGGSVDVAA